PLPKPLSLDEVRHNTPPIPAMPEHSARPFWSVMIPTWNCARYLRKTLQSVLSQDSGPDQMHIEVIDDCSTKDDPRGGVSHLGIARVELFRQPSNQGATRICNTCFQRARGRWVHLLRGDDMVLPGFYAAVRGVIEANPQVNMVLGKVVTIDDH